MEVLEVIITKFNMIIYIVKQKKVIYFIAKDKQSKFFWNNKFSYKNNDNQ